MSDETLHVPFEITNLGDPHKTTVDVLAIFADSPIAVLITGYDPRRMYAYYEPLTEEQLRSYEYWGFHADICVDLAGSNRINDVRAEAQTLWPEVAVYEFGCLCCCTDDLLKWNE